jgi:NodT family efflux transporter outer membrane factor (OMF) lipoprotein
LPRNEQDTAMKRSFRRTRDARRLLINGERRRRPTSWCADILTVLGIIGLASVQSSCTVGPNYVRPKVETPVAYKELDGWKTAQPQDGAIRGNWWELYNDAQLNDLTSQIEISNQSLAAAQAQFRQARAMVQVARAAYFPTVTAGVAASRYRNSGNVPTNTPAFIGPWSNFQATGDLSWEIDVWGRVRRNVESSQATAQASAAEVASVRLSMQAELAMDYFQLRGLDAQSKLLGETIVAYQKALDLTTLLFKGGAASEADVVQAQAQLKTTQAQAIDIGVQRAQLEHAVAVLIGKPPASFTIPPSPLAALPPAVPAGVPSEVLERRPDIAAAERMMAAANAQIGVAEAAYYPIISLSAIAGFSSKNVSDWFTWPSRFFAVGPTVAQTVFDGGLRGGLTASARAGYDGTVASYRQTVLTAFQEVEDNLAALRILEQEATVQNDAVIAAQRSVALTTDQYKVGIVSYLNVVTAQTFALTDERSAVDIATRRMVSSVLLVKGLGGGWTASSLPSNAALISKDDSARLLGPTPAAQSSAASGNQR